MTTVMKAVRLYGIGDLRVETVDRPLQPAAGEVRLKVLAAGVCGSDLHNVRTGQWLSRIPATPGHEVAGEIVAIGDSVSGLAVGDRVVVDSRVGCGECACCREGRANLCSHLGFVGEVCDGGFAEELTVPALLLTKVPGDIEAAAVAMAEPLAVALHAVRRLGAKAGEPVLIAGCGPIGGLVALALARAGAGPILVCDRNEGRLRLVCEVTGAVPVSLADRDAVRIAAGGAPLRHGVEATGQVGVAARLLDLVDNGATLALVGIFHERLDLDPNHLVEREIALLGCSAFAGELAEAVAMLPALEADLLRFCETPIALDAVPDAFRRLIAGQTERLKTVIVPEKTGLERGGTDGIDRSAAPHQN